jgi:hypothetical protein
MNLEPGHWLIIVFIAGWTAVMLSGMWQSHHREVLRHRERLAMIDRGIPLPPEPPPATPLYTLSGASTTEDPKERERRILRFMRFIGVLTVAAGVGIYLLLTIMSLWVPGVGLGGLMLIVGGGLMLTTSRALRLIGRSH